MATKFVPRPDHVFVGNHTYGINWLTQEEWDERHLPSDSDAVTYAAAQFIGVQIRGGAAESHYQEIVWHEVTHACWDWTMLTHVDNDDLPKNLEEFIIAAMSPLQTFVIKQNPHLMAWLTSDGTVVR